MPSKNTIKTYIENGCYHVYNRGVEKRRIFEEAEDYKKFLEYLKIYLSPIEDLRKENPLLKTNLINGNLSEEIEVLAYCLMPNHFHILIKQKTKNAITKLMRQLTTAYSMYFNKKYERVGPLFQGIFKACLVDKNEVLLHLSKYIHQNPQERGISLGDFPWSSYPAYLGSNSHQWLKPQEILNYLSTSNPDLPYKVFVEETKFPQGLIEAYMLETH